ncbi:hypothetical protein A1QO_02630 [Vibrio genomosp. F10 str. ZF-129]|uniref:Uncharacterized protein n=1 Tax=Vibrio genomosp. F10 str. ZF-129 TaxID=1187848 RepID=A0A1E5BK95_9VIBR|nr:hypothetical protein [Vibrio genomosp. F10]OEE38293.1 hypothetical protein A1QO_02630 [Vibrio genomosp. F10 str. ZF-129]
MKRKELLALLKAHSEKQVKVHIKDGPTAFPTFVDNNFMNRSDINIDTENKPLSTNEICKELEDVQKAVPIYFWMSDIDLLKITNYEVTDTLDFFVQPI